VRDIQWKGLCGGERSDLLQLFDHGSIANVLGVKYGIDAFKIPSNYWIKQAVGVGNHSDPMGSAGSWGDDWLGSD
jgi:hypothetical protein